MWSGDLGLTQRNGRNKSYGFHYQFFHMLCPCVTTWHSTQLHPQNASSRKQNNNINILFVYCTKLCVALHCITWRTIHTQYQLKITWSVLCHGFPQSPKQMLLLLNSGNKHSHILSNSLFTTIQTLMTAKGLPTPANIVYNLWKNCLQTVRPQCL